MSSLDAHFEREHVRSPDGAVCGLPVLIMFPAVGFGALAGVVAGGLVAEVVTLLTRKWSVVPISLFGNRDETRDRLLTIIPLGTPRDVAVTTVTENGMRCSVHVDPLTNEPFLWCVHGNVSDRNKLQVWQIRVDCAHGVVSKVICQQAGPYN